MARQINISIKNWDIYNPRRDLKSMPWVRLQGDIAFSESLFGLTAEAKWLWIFLLSYSSKKMSGDFQIDESYLSHYSCVTASKIENYLNVFLERGLLSIKSGTSRITNESDRITNESDHNQNDFVPNERTNERTNVIVNGRVDYTHPLELDPEKVNNSSFQEKADGLAEMWNDMAELNNLPKVKIPVSADRVKAMTPAMKEFTNIDDWYKIICTVTDNPFNLGDNDRKWKANFDWLFHKTKYNYRKLWEARNESSF